MAMDQQKYKRIGKFFAKINLVSSLILLSYLYFHLDGIYMARIFRLPISIYAWISLGSSFFLFFKPNGLFISMGFFNFLYIFIEVIAFVVVCFKTDKIQWEGFNRPCSHYDEVSGYLWDNSDSCRITRIAEGHIIYDQKFKANNMGYISNIDYHYKKGDKKRYMLFGDSFTCAEFLKTPLGNRLNELARKDSLDVEIYSFAQDGAGLANWHNIYFKDIIKNYEFDGIILASWFDNWQREFSVLHMTDDGGYFTRANGISGTKKDVLPKITLERNNIWSIASDNEINDMLAIKDDIQIFVIREANLYFIKNACKALERMYLNFKSISQEQKKEAIVVDQKYFDNKFSQESIQQINEILSHANENDIDIIIASVPRKMWANPVKFKERNGKKVYHQLELEFFTKKYNTKYFDGYTPFHQLELEDFMAHWLTYDGHWNQKGLDLYSEHFIEQFRK